MYFMHGVIIRLDLFFKKIVDQIELTYRRLRRVEDVADLTMIQIYAHVITIRGRYHVIVSYGLGENLERSIGVYAL